MPSNPQNKRQLFDLSKRMIDFFNVQLEKTKSLEGDNDEEIIYKQIVLQYNLIAKQDLESIFLLYKNKQLFTPHFIVRNMVEHLITLAYIEKDKLVRAREYSLFGIKKHRTLINTSLKNQDVFKDESFQKRIKEIENDFIENKDEIDNWKSSIEQRAQSVGLYEVYQTAYRYLSILSHPDSNNTKYFFEEKNDKLVFKDFNQDSSLINLPVALAMSRAFITIFNDEFKLSVEDNNKRLLREIGNLTPTPPDGLIWQRK